MSSDSLFRPLEFRRYSESEMRARATALREHMDQRRTVREFSDEPIPMDVLDECIRAAGSAPSGAHRQPWTFVVLTDPEVRSRLRAAAEEEERINYSGRMNEEWLHALEPLGTDASKPFLENAPALIIVLRHAWDVADGQRIQNYYTQESVGIASGFLIAALHNAGLATLTHTPSPMNFMCKILERPENEKPYLLIPVGYPVEDCEVPRLTRKSLDELVVRL
ncbi:MAG: iodotyrosine deiodinase [Chlamydiales bacterium]|jgi:iodotyrosine deiodinase